MKETVAARQAPHDELSRRAFVSIAAAALGTRPVSAGESVSMTDVDLTFLKRCVALAERALDAGDQPFGSLLVAADGRILFEDRNHVAAGDHTQHPEFAIARWAATNLSPQERRAATVYTSGEHCPMCAAAHGWVGLGRIVYASSSEQLVGWLRKLGAPSAPVRALPIRDVVPDAVVAGPAPELADTVRDLHARYYGKAGPPPP